MRRQTWQLPRLPHAGYGPAITMARMRGMVNVHRGGVCRRLMQILWYSKHTDTPALI